GKVALVTGGSRGLGLDMATGLGEAGASLVITARREQWLKTAEAELRAKGISCAAVSCDVADPDQAQAAVKASVDRFGRLDIRVNAIAPGFFDTRLSHSLLEKTLEKIENTTPMGRIGQPGELAGVAVFLASAASSYVTGQVLAVDGGMTA